MPESMRFRFARFVGGLIGGAAFHQALASGSTPLSLTVSAKLYER